MKMSLLLLLCLLCPLMGDELPPKPGVRLPFPVGESLEYDLYWGWIGVGRSVASTRWDFHEGRWQIVIEFTTRTNHVLDRLYPVEDFVQTRVDAETLRPVHFVTRLNAGRHSRDEETRFDWENMRAVYRRFREEGRVEEKSYPIQDGVRDLVSFMYFMRDQELAPNTTSLHEVIVNDKLYELEVNTRREQRVNLKNYGRVDSLRIDPRASFEGVFVRKGDMAVWLSRDPRRILTKLEVSTPFASAKILLRNVRGPGEDFWILQAEPGE